MRTRNNKRRRDTAVLDGQQQKQERLSLAAGAVEVGRPVWTNQFDDGSIWFPAIVKKIDSQHRFSLAFDGKLWPGKFSRDHLRPSPPAPFEHCAVHDERRQRPRDAPPPAAATPSTTAAAAHMSDAVASPSTTTPGPDLAATTTVAAAATTTPTTVVVQSVREFVRAQDENGWASWKKMGLLLLLMTRQAHALYDTSECSTTRALKRAAQLFLRHAALAPWQVFWALMVLARARDFRAIDVVSELWVAALGAVDAASIDDETFFGTLTAAFEHADVLAAKEMPPAKQRRGRRNGDALGVLGKYSYSSRVQQWDDAVKALIKRLKTRVDMRPNEPWLRDAHAAIAADINDLAAAVATYSRVASGRTGGLGSAYMRMCVLRNVRAALRGLYRDGGFLGGPKERLRAKERLLQVMSVEELSASGVSEGATLWLTAESLESKAAILGVNLGSRGAARRLVEDLLWTIDRVVPPDQRESCRKLWTKDTDEGDLLLFTCLGFHGALRDAVCRDIAEEDHVLLRLETALQAHGWARWSLHWRSQYYAKHQTGDDEFLAYESKKVGCLAAPEAAVFSFLEYVESGGKTVATRRLRWELEAALFSEL